MMKEWKIRYPRIVLVIVSNVMPLNQWKNTRQLENFQRGLIKAANTTEMWIFTYGINSGIAKVIGDAVQEELLRREVLRCHRHTHQYKTSLPPISLIGIPRDDLLTHSEMLDAGTDRVELPNDGNHPEDNKYSLNSDHSHFIVVKDGTINKTGINHFLLRLEKYLSCALELEAQQRKSASFKGPSGTDCPLGSNEIPVIAVLIQGGPDCARLILDHLKKQLPVVVIRGSGGLADLIAFAYNEVQDRPQGINDAEFVENVLKPELSIKISQDFSKLRDNNLTRNMFRDRILECVRYANQHSQIYLTILNIHDHSCNLEKLDEHLLKALFKSQKSDTTNWKDQIQKDLYLTLDWNNPQIAMTEVFLKDPSNIFEIDKLIFEEALLRLDREDFVALFLNQGFRVHKYLTPKRLSLLFKKAHNQEFFRSVCWESALGHAISTKLPRNFVETDLNWLIASMTGIPNFIKSQELSLNALGLYDVDSAAAERKARVILAMWAVFTNRSKLAKLLWLHSDQPIHLALIISMIYERLHTHVPESNLQAEMMRLSKEFAEIATGVLDACYNDASCRAYDILYEENPDWVYKTAVDIAADGKNRTFLAHPCCQKWLTNMFFGKVRIRDVTFGVFPVPLPVKVVLCAFFIFPMYIWVRFKTDIYPSWEANDDASDTDDEKDEQDDATLIQGNDQSVQTEMNDSKNKKSHDELPRAREREVFVCAQPPIWKMVYLMWNAPITKFWTFQVFYIIYLVVFSLAVMWPSCGNKVLDLIVCSWTCLIVLESAQRTYMLYKKYSSVPLFFKCVEILLIIIFVIMYLFSRILDIGIIVDPYNGKVLLCCGLIYFYYRIIAICLPISPALGPLLYRVKLMVLEDFMNFMRMTLLVIISGGIVIHASLYPDYPLSAELFRRTFHRAWFSLFLTPIDDLQGDSSCVRWKDRPINSSYCKVGKYIDSSCPNTGLWPYLFSIQYFVFLKLILLTLLYALFSATASKLQSESDSIWRFQRYQLVVDFANRLRLPAPLNFISYILLFIEYLFKLLTCKLCRKRSQIEDNLRGSPVKPRLSAKDYNYWRQLAFEYIKMIETKEQEKQYVFKQMAIIKAITEDIDYQKKTMHKMRGQMRELERMMTYSHVYLENIKHLTLREHEKIAASKHMLHILARHSPYPGTRIQRCPVPDKYVPWEIMWIEYDPVAFTLPRHDFNISLWTHVDEDILRLREEQGPSHKLPVFQWNSMSINPAGIAIDRQSWILTEDGTPVIYNLDSEGIPQNPVGRTGLKGRAGLPRWGPNHYVHIIITRWQRSKDTLLTTKGLECVVTWRERRNQPSIPGGFVSGEDRYEVVRSIFKTSDSNSDMWRTKEHMIGFFKNCCIPPSNATEEEIAASENKVICEEVMQGYMDDTMNTDHAWKEVQLWHVHYDIQENLADKMQSNVVWRLITEDIFAKLPPGQAVLLQDIARQLKAVIF